MFQIWQLIDGLLNLLKNDYYLDLKTEAINKYIEKYVGPHIDDPSIHISRPDIEQYIDKKFVVGRAST